MSSTGDGVDQYNCIIVRQHSWLDEKKKRKYSSIYNYIESEEFPTLTMKVNFAKDVFQNSFLTIDLKNFHSLFESWVDYNDSTP